MPESNAASLTCPDATPRTTVVDQLRAPDLTVVAIPTGQTSFTRADLNAALEAEGLRPVGLGEPYAHPAFRADLTDGAA